VFAAGQAKTINVSALQHAIQSPHVVSQAGSKSNITIVTTTPGMKPQLLD